MSLVELRKGEEGYLAKMRSTCKQLYSPEIDIEGTFWVTVVSHMQVSDDNLGVILFWCTLTIKYFSNY